MSLSSAPGANPDWSKSIMEAPLLFLEIGLDTCMRCCAAKGREGMSAGELLEKAFHTCKKKHPERDVLSFHWILFYVSVMPANVAGHVSQLNQPLSPIGEYGSLF